jgi:hypothetical protein
MPWQHSWAIVLMLLANTSGLPVLAQRMKSVLGVSQSPLPGASFPRHSGSAYIERNAKIKYFQVDPVFIKFCGIIMSK